MKGRIITLDGMSGSGKSTQILLLKDYLKEHIGLEQYEIEDVRIFREPSSFLRKKIKEYRALPTHLRDSSVETLLFAADRRQQYVWDVAPALEENALILMDRSLYSSVAYQGRDMDEDEILRINGFFPDVDLALFFVCEPEVALSRIKRREQEERVRTPRSDDESLEGLRALKSGFERLAESVPASQIIASDGSEQAVFQQLRSHVDALLKKEMPRVVFLDKDGVLVDNACYPEVPCDVIYPGSAQALKKLKDAGYRLHIVSNQSWIAKGMLSQKRVEDIFESVMTQYARRGVDIDGYSYCPHRTEDNCACKKPGTGMLESIISGIGADTRHSFMIGDMAKDVQAGQRMGMKTILVETGCGRSEKVMCKADYVARDLLTAADYILRVECS